MTAKEIVQQRDRLRADSDALLAQQPELPSFTISAGQAEFAITKLGELCIGVSSTPPILVHPARAAELAAWLSELYPPKVRP